MINRQEISDFSREFGLAANVVEKDYVLGWLLAGISGHSELGSSWIFKGGTCLKKCYFETYRFSEDLDFTVVQSDHQDEAFLVEAFKQIADWVYDASGIEIPHELIRFDVYTNPRGKISVQGRIGYRGPLRPGGDLPRVKLDLTDDEVLVLNPSSREVHHPYTDRPDGGVSAQCYSFEEVFAEKVRALAERLRPRDLYDVIHLFRHDSTKHSRKLILSTLEKKCAFKSIPVPTLEFLADKPERAELETEWENMLGHQVPVLPPFGQFWQELPQIFDWLYRTIVKPAPSAMPAMGRAVDVSWHPPATAQAWHTSAPLELIRYAAVNRLCVQLNYTDAKGMQKNQVIEPYSLRRTKDGNLLLYAVKHESGEDRAYRVDRIRNVEVTKISFTSRYVVELTTSGIISAPPIARRSKSGIALPIRTFASKKSRRTSSSYGPKYVFECTLCGKRFTRKSSAPTLRAHKDKQGYPCPGRTGIYVTMKY